MPSKQEFDYFTMVFLATHLNQPGQQVIVINLDNKDVSQRVVRLYSQAKQEELQFHQYNEWLQAHFKHDSTKFDRWQARTPRRAERIRSGNEQFSIENTNKSITPVKKKEGKRKNFLKVLKA